MKMRRMRTKIMMRRTTMRALMPDLRHLAAPGVSSFNAYRAQQIYM